MGLFDEQQKKKQSDYLSQLIYNSLDQNLNFFTNESDISQYIGISNQNAGGIQEPPVVSDVDPAQQQNEQTGQSGLLNQEQNQSNLQVPSLISGFNQGLKTNDDPFGIVDNLTKTIQNQANQSSFNNGLKLSTSTNPVVRQFGQSMIDRSRKNQDESFSKIISQYNQKTGDKPDNKESWFNSAGASTLGKGLSTGFDLARGIFGKQTDQSQGEKMAWSAMDQVGKIHPIAGAAVGALKMIDSIGATEHKSVASIGTGVDSAFGSSVNKGYEGKTVGLFSGMFGGNAAEERKRKKAIYNNGLKLFLDDKANGWRDRANDPTNILNYQSMIQGTPNMPTRISAKHGAKLEPNFKYKKCLKSFKYKKGGQLNDFKYKKYIERKPFQYKKGGSLTSNFEYSENPNIEEVIIFKGGGNFITDPYMVFLRFLPDNLRTPSDDYNMKRYWELNGKPKDFLEGIAKKMFTLEDDGYYHASTVAYNEDIDEYEFMKSPNHDTIHFEEEWYNSDKPDAIEFRKNYELIKPSDGSNWKYIRRNPEKYQKGGAFNVIPEGALHARKHNMELDGITKKGIPVISEGEGGNIEQQAEIELNEIILRYEVTQRIEKLWKEYNKSKNDDLAIEAGQILVQEILYNTQDRTGLIQDIN